MDFEKMEQYWNENVKQYIPFRRGPMNTVMNAFWGILMVIVVRDFYKEPDILWVIMMLISVGVLWTNLWMHTIFYWAIGFVIFPLAEMACIQAGAWHYAEPSILYNYVPLWLFPLWGNVFVIARKWDSTPVKALIRKMLRLVQ